MSILPFVPLITGCLVGAFALTVGCREQPALSADAKAPFSASEVEDFKLHEQYLEYQGSMKAKDLWEPIMGQDIQGMINLQGDIGHTMDPSTYVAAVKDFMNFPEGLEPDTVQFFLERTLVEQQEYWRDIQISEPQPEEEKFDFQLQFGP